MPPLESTYFTAGTAYVQLKDLARAESIIRAGINAYPTVQLRVELAAILADEGRRTDAIAVLDACRPVKLMSPLSL